MTDHAKVLRNWGTGTEWPEKPDYALIDAADHIDTLARDLAEARQTCGLLQNDREALWGVVKESCAVLRVTDDDENDWPKLTRTVDALAADLAEARATLDAVAALVGGGDVVERCRQIIADRDELASAFREHVEAVDNARYCYCDATLWRYDGHDDRIDAAEQRLFVIERAQRVNP